MGKTVRIQAGQWKGYLGTVSHTTATHVQVELHSRLKKVMVVKERVHVVGDKFGATDNGDGSNGMSATSNTPFAGGITPMHHGGETPMYGGATPMHGGATPMHDGFGSATPSHTGVTDDIWRPGGSLDREDAGEEGWTPLSGSIKEDHPYEDSSVVTGGMQIRATLLAFFRSVLYSFAFIVSLCPQASGWGTSSEQGSTWTPSASTMDTSIKQEPSGYSHMHGDSGAMDSAIEGGEETAVWFMERVCVQLKQSNAEAVIKEINGSMAIVELEDKSTTTVRNGDVSMVPPQEHDMVLVTGGADVGVEGELVCIDGTDAILKESNENFKIVDFVHLAKISAS